MPSNSELEQIKNTFQEAIKHCELQDWHIATEKFLTVLSSLPNHQSTIQNLIHIYSHDGVSLAIKQTILQFIVSHRIELSVVNFKALTSNTDHPNTLVLLLILACGSDQEIPTSRVRPTKITIDQKEALTSLIDKYISESTVHALITMYEIILEDDRPQFLEILASANLKKTEVQLTLAILQTRHNEKQQACETFKLVADYQPKNLALLLKKMWAEYSLARYRNACDTGEILTNRGVKNFEKHLVLGLSLLKLNKNQAAILELESAMALDRFDPRVLSAMSAALNQSGDIEQARKFAQKALEIKPTHQNALVNLGMAQMHLDEPMEAQKSLRAALSIESDDFAAHLNLGLLELQQGNVKAGFRHYEWRLKDPTKTYRREAISTPRVTSPNQLYDEGNKILVWGEQGLGDQLIGLNLFHKLVQHQPNMQLSLDPKLKGIVAPVHVSKPAFKKEGGYTHQLPILSIGNLFSDSLSENLDKFQRRPTIESKVEISTVKTLGLSWYSPAALVGQSKSLPPNVLSELIEALGPKSIFNLQYFPVASETELYADQIKHLLPVNDTFNDLINLATIIRKCDIVVTISNSIAHIAGHLGVPTICIVPNAHGQLWYWSKGFRDNCGRSFFYNSVLVKPVNLSNARAVIDRVIGN